ncbi:MAG TPA: hypothetical protein VLV78_01430 [Thermoanaerobaculia bacterium]|nr:hypothetical protein [Thermoanaerobaculia bacterium]
MTAGEERRRALEKRLGLSKAHGTVLTIVFFGLTILAVAAFFGLCKLLSFPAGWITAISCIALAETLLRRTQLGGVADALWISGLFAWILDLPSEGKPEGWLLLAAASAIAGARLRNAWFGALAAIFVISYLGAKDWYLAALLAGVMIAALSLAALTREWQRPSTEMLLILVMIVCPVAGAVVSIEKTSLPWALLYIALAIAEVAVGMRYRHRAALFGSAVSLAIAIVVLREMFTFALEWKMILAGAVMFAISVAISRALRGRSRGFVMTPVKSAYEEALRVFGSAAFAPRVDHAAAPAQQPVSGGGSFGGAGSTGDF